MGRVRALIKSCWVGARRERARDVTITTIEIPGIWNFRKSELLFHFTFCVSDHHDQTLAFRWVTSGVYVLSCRLTSGPLWLGIYLFLWWFLFVIFGLFLLHWRYELPCQDKLPEFHSTPILVCIRILWLVSRPLGLGLDKALCGWNSVTG